MVKTPVVSASTTAPKDAASEVSDHEKFVGRFAIGYFGVSDVLLFYGPIATGVHGVSDADATFTQGYPGNVGDANGDGADDLLIVDNYAGASGDAFLFFGGW